MEGDVQAKVGWFIIKWVKGEFYPCDPAVFWLTYEPINEMKHLPIAGKQRNIEEDSNESPRT